MKYFRWISKKVYIRRKVKSRSIQKKYIENKEGARDLVKERLHFFNQHYKFNIGRIAIKNHKTRWGSCSSKGNLNFNYKIVFLPPRIADYIVVHELCHLGQFNHSSKFWSLVSETIPDYEKLKQELRGIRV